MCVGGGGGGLTNQNIGGGVRSAFDKIRIFTFTCRVKICLFV